MNRKTLFEEERDLPPDDYRWQGAFADGRHHACVRTHIGRGELQQHSLNQSLGAHRLVVDLRWFAWETLSPLPVIEDRGLFFDQHLLDLSRNESLRRPIVEHEQGTDEYHDSESAEDVYDLFNACNGVLHNDLLDIRLLDEYSPADAVALNVPRLRKIWEHTASGCPECKAIIRTLNLIRDTLGEDAEESFNELPEAADANGIDSIS